MIEDALKSTRALHRLIMAVSLVTIVFALSIIPPEDKTQQKQIIDGLSLVNLTAYDEFAEARISEQTAAHFSPEGDIYRKLEADDLYPGNVQEIADQLQSSLHEGRVFISKFIPSGLPERSISELNKINNLPLEKNIQLVFLDVDNLYGQIKDFLEVNWSPAWEIDNFVLDKDSLKPNDDGFVDSGPISIPAYLNYHRHIDRQDGPQLNFDAVANIVEIEDSSFIYWLGSTQIDEEFLTVENDQVIFAPGLRSADANLFDVPLVDLSSLLGDEIIKSDASPTNQTISILGTEVPGSLAVLASPLILVALSYYFNAHTGHLTRLVSRGRQNFEEFSWLPISIETTFDARIRGRKVFSISFGLLECFNSAVFLPAMAMALLYWQTSAFEELAMVQTSILTGAAIGVVLFGILSLMNVHQIRTALSQKID
ncbi:hypothetical protein [Ruegeria atlantica]|uniref:hypothetical protein n=1 Tax=Ruegeria atlantica TaxID=81569 RepID=UPI00147DE873|nr:hypothetical protein [Ruegeria atlantica]